MKDNSGKYGGPAVPTQQERDRIRELTHAYNAEDWHKAGFAGEVGSERRDDATDRRAIQEKMRALVPGVNWDGEVIDQRSAGAAPVPMKLSEQVEFVNRATAVSRGIARKEDMVNLPGHYARFKIEPIRFIGENKLDWFQGNIVKYLMRHDAKNGLEDVRKAIRYANMYLLYLQNDPDWWKAGKPEDLKIGAE